MITSDYIRERFSFYKKWLDTLLIKEFLNLPYKEQTKFIVMIEKFLEDCKKVHEEAKSIEEKIIRIQIVDVLQHNDFYIITGKTPESPHEIKIKCHKKGIIPTIGSSIDCIIFKGDKDDWFSLKEELITEGIKNETQMVSLGSERERKQNLD